MIISFIINHTSFWEEEKMKENVLQLKNVTWRRENTTLLSKVNWTIQKHEHWALLGLNGSGKTTLLNIINGYIWPTEGTIEVLGAQFGKTSLPELRKSIGWVSSSLQEKIPKLQYAQDVVISGKYASIGLYERVDEEDITKALDLMEKLDCSKLINRHYETCSQGERQKLLIARALMSEPKLLILDEPCNGLDIFARENLLETIQQLAEDPEGPTLIYVTHHPEEILPVFNHTLLLRKGNVFMQGNTEEILSEKHLTAFFEHPVSVNWYGERASFQLVR